MPVPPQLVDLATLILLAGIIVYGYIQVYEYIHVRVFYVNDGLKYVVQIIMFLIITALVLNLYDLIELMFFH